MYIIAQRDSNGDLRRIRQYGREQVIENVKHRVEELKRQEIDRANQVEIERPNDPAAAPQLPTAADVDLEIYEVTDGPSGLELTRVQPSESVETREVREITLA